MITGPGNIYVTAAKRICRSQVGIDAEAGPTEIAILADHTADPVHVAADLISQAEHDEMAASVLVTASADARRRHRSPNSPRQLETTVHRERVTAALTGRQSAIVLVDDLDAGVRSVNAYAAEHLEIQTADAARGGGPDPFGRSDFRRCRGRRSASATTARAPTTCCPPRAARGTPAGCRCRPSCAASTSSTTPRRRSRTCPGYVITLAKAENLPAHGEAVRRRFETVTPGNAGDPGRPAAARGPARQVALRRTATRRCRCGSTPTRTRTRRRRRWSTTSPSSVRAVAAELHRYPDRDAVALRTDLAAYLTRPDRRRRWRREPLGGQRIQRDPAAAAAGVRRAGPQRDRLRAVVLDAPDHLRRHPDRVDGRRPRRRLQPRRRRRGRRDQASATPTSCSSPARTTRRARAFRSTSCAGCSRP